MYVLGMRRRAVVWWAVVTTLGLAVSGCSDSSNPAPAPLPSTSPTNTASSAAPSPTAPTLPAEARGTSAASAKAFARHYFDAVNYAARTGDVKYLRSLGTSSCVSCDAIARNIDSIYSAGGRIESEGWKLRGVRTLRAQRRSAVLSLNALLGPEIVVRSTNGPREQHKGGKQPMTMRLVTDLGAWKVSALDLVS